MKVLFIGGTGNISSSVSKLCVERGIGLYLLNRGKRESDLHGANTIPADISNIDKASSILEGHEWDVVVDWIAYTEDHVTRDFELFRGRTRQYVFISSASAYEKPPRDPIITEKTPLRNPYWEYSRKKIACERMLFRLYHEQDFPITIVRPSFTYDTVIPLAIGGWDEYTVIDRMKKGKKVIIHGDGTTLWTVTHAEDFAKGFVALLGQSFAIGEDFQITSDEVLTWNQMYGITAEALKVDPNIVHIATDFICQCEPSLVGTLLGDKAHCAIFDNGKIKSHIDFSLTTIPFKEGIRKTLARFDADPNRRIILTETNEMMDRIINTYENKGIH